MERIVTLGAWDKLRDFDVERLYHGKGHAVIRKPDAMGRADGRGTHDRDEAQ